MHIGAVAQGDLVVPAQREHAAGARAVIVGVDFAGIDRQCSGADEDAAAAAEILGVADVEGRAALDVDQAEARHRQPGGVARIDWHLAGPGDAGHVDRAGGCGEGGAGDRDRSGDDAEGPRHRSEGAAVDCDRSRPRRQKTKGRRRRGAQGAAIGVGRLKLRPIRQFQVIGGRGMKAARDVDRRVRSKDDAARVDQVEVSPGDVGLNLAVDRGRVAAGHPADDVIDRRGPVERGAFAGRQTKLAEAVEEVAADLLAETGADRVVGPDHRLRRREAAIDGNVLGCGAPRHHGRKQAG